MTTPERVTDEMLETLITGCSAGLKLEYETQLSVLKELRQRRRTDRAVIDEYKKSKSTLYRPHLEAAIEELLP